VFARVMGAKVEMTVKEIDAPLGKGRTIKLKELSEKN
jgi:hypothetical protein